jgi:hypothetical protein
MSNWAIREGYNYATITISAVMILFAVISPVSGQILIGGAEKDAYLRDHYGHYFGGRYEYTIELETIGTAMLNGGMDNGNQWLFTSHATVDIGCGDAVGNAASFGGYCVGSGHNYIGNLCVGEGGTLDTELYFGMIGELTFAPDGGGLLRISGASFDNFNAVNIEGNVDLTGTAILLSFLSSSIIESDFNSDLATAFNFTGDGGFLTENWWEEISYVGATQQGNEFILYLF